MSDCACGSGRSYEDCCHPYISGKASAPTAEALMRSRYSAYANQAISYLHETLHPEHRADHDLNAAKRWAAQSQWLGLQVGVVEGGGEDDDEGTVEFTATYKERGAIRQFHEISRFARIDGRWYYVDGEIVKPDTVTHEAPKVGRNEPCPCGSGKKFKKCCGR